jgi:hypothetical protein
MQQQYTNYYAQNHAGVQQVGLPHHPQPLYSSYTSAMHEQANDTEESSSEDDNEY